MSFPLKRRKTKAEETSLPSLRPLESIHHLTEDKPWQFCQNSNQQIASCSACPRQSATVDDKQSDGHSLNYRGKGRASNDPGPILDCAGCLVSSSQRHQGFFFFFFFSPPLALSWIWLPAEMLIVKAGLSACDQVQAWVSKQSAPATGINAYIIREASLLCLPLSFDVDADIMQLEWWLIVRLWFGYNGHPLRFIK